MPLPRATRILLAIELAVILIVTTLNYLPNLSKATIYRDDWYYTMDRMLGGPEAFHVMFSIDRPARGYFFETYYQLFGVDPRPYHAVAFAFRLLVGTAAFWLFLILYPRKWQAALVFSLLFALFPGYTRWMEGFENQPNIVSLFCEVMSIILTLEAMKTRRTALKVLYWGGSILSGLIYILLIDYAIGMEAFRWLCVYLVIQHQDNRPSLLQKGVAALRAALPALLVPGIFLFWRLFIFNNQRPETDINLQLSVVTQSPLNGLVSWMIGLVKSVGNTAIIPWAGPYFSDLFNLERPQILTGLGIALAALACIGLGLYLVRRLRSAPPDESESCPEAWAREAMLIGLLGTTAGVLPVVMANRSVALGIYSHYAVPASLAAALVICGLLYCIRSQQVRLSLFGVLILLAVTTHYAASARVVVEEQTISNFWQQVVWRAPGIREATGLMVYYPGVNYGEDVDAVSGPANFIYFNQPSNELPVRYSLQAMKQYPWTVTEYLSGQKQTLSYRTHYGVIDPGHLLVMSQPTQDSCVHIIDRTNPWFSFDDPNMVVTIGQNSNLKTILPKATPPQLSKVIFGTEPAHGWCYYFEKAELARQQNDWARVLSLAAEVERGGLQPGQNQPLEWMPFLQAYAQQGDLEHFKSLAAQTTQSAYNKVQTCNVLKRMQESGSTFSQDIQSEIQKTICPPPESPAN